MVEGIEQGLTMVSREEVGLGQPLPSVAASMAFGTLVFMAMATAPMMLGGLVSAGRLTNNTLGLVATLEMLGIAAGSAVGPDFLRASAFRTKVFVSCLMLVVLNVACMHALDAAPMALLRGACGLFEGLVLAAANLILTYTRNPEGMNGYFLGITTIPQVAATYMLSSYWIPHFGPNIGFELMAAVAIVAAVAAIGASGKTIPPAPAKGGAQSHWTGFAVAALAAVVLQNAAIGAGYSYMVQIAKQHAVPDGVVGVSMAALQATAAAGALAVGIVGWRISQVLMLTLGCLIQAAVVLDMLYLGSPAAYALGAGLFGLCWNGLLPYSLKLLIELDPSRRLALLNSPASLAGFGVGPFVASWFVSPADVSPAFMVAALMFGGSGAAYLVINILSRSLRRRALA